MTIYKWIICNLWTIAVKKREELVDIIFGIKSVFLENKELRTLNWKERILVKSGGNINISENVLNEHFQIEGRFPYHKGRYSFYPQHTESHRKLNSLHFERTFLVFHEKLIDYQSKNYILIKKSNVPSRSNVRYVTMTIISLY